MRATKRTALLDIGYEHQCTRRDAGGSRSPLSFHA